MRSFGIIGYPLGHSFSQRYFTEKFAREGITDAVFKVFPIPDITALPAMLQAEKELEGFCITIPHKKSVIAYLDETSAAVRAMQACNCVRIRQGKLYGYNTDTIGFERSFTPQLQPHHTQALILGTGGAAAAVEYALQKLGIGYRFVSRKKLDGQFTYEELTEEVLASYPVIINCTPLGTYPNVEEAPPIPYQYINSRHYLYDLVYNPAVTRFLQEGVNRQALIKNGYDMLTIQAEENWKIWNDQAPA